MEKMKEEKEKLLNLYASQGFKKLKYELETNSILGGLLYTITPIYSKQTIEVVIETLNSEYLTDFVFNSNTGKLCS